MLAMIRTSLPHSLQDVISILHIRFNRPLLGPTVGAPMSLLRGAQRGFGLVVALLFYPLYLCPVWLASPLSDTWYLARTPRGNGSDGLWV